jgi:TRAP-type C4-dicarboxylate transport system permease small subunit
MNTQSAIVVPVPAAQRPGLYSRACFRLARTVLLTAVVGLLTIVLAVAYQVFGRYILNDTPTWAESLALLLILWVTMFGAAIAVRDAGHIGFESLMELAPSNVRLWLQIVIHGLIGFFGATMVWYGWGLVQSVITYNIPILGVSEGLNYLPTVISGALIVLFSIDHIVALLTGVELELTWR